MKSILRILVICLLVSVSALAQISQGGTPYSIENASKMSKTTAKRQTQTVSFMSVNNEAEKKRVEKIMDECQTCRKDYYGTGIDAKIDLVKDGTFYDLGKEGRLWLTKVSSLTAFGMQFYFSKYKLPTGAKLFIYNEDKSMILGAFTSENNNEDGKFATQIISGEAVTIEYFEPLTAEFSGSLEIYKVIHVFKDLGNKGLTTSKANSYGASGTCNIDINCPDGANYQDVKRGVCRISTYDVGNTLAYHCSGSVINTTSRDRKYYILTANHCVGTLTWEPTTQYEYNANARIAEWIFEFNYEVFDCNNKSAPFSTNTLQGAKILSRGDLSDYALLDLTQAIPESYGVAYLGWDRSSTEISNGVVGIHHPVGDVKKISFDNNFPVLAHWGYLAGESPVRIAGPPNTDWDVTWDKGVTAHGSSGSPLFNQKKLIIGQLRSGISRCSSEGGAINGPDQYGRLAISWDNPYPEYSNRPLSFYLDPINSGVASLETYDTDRVEAKFFNTPDPLNSLRVYFTDISTPETQLTAWSWNFGDGSTSTEKNPSHIYPYAGSFIVSLSVNRGFEQNKVVKFIYVYSKGSDSLNAAFTASTTTGPAPIIVDFANNTGNITSRTWTISPSTGYNYVTGNTNAASIGIKFTNPGTYIVKLQVANGSSSISSEKTIVVTSNSTPVVDFSWQSPVYSGTQVTFRNKSFYTCSGYNEKLWTFSDGGSSFLEDGINVFSFPGTYDVSLCIKDECGNNICTSKKITVLDPTNAVTPYFVPDRITIRKGETVTFYDKSFPISMIDHWSWYFELDKRLTGQPANRPDDGWYPTRGRPSQVSISHTYNKAGMFKVRLYVAVSEFSAGSFYDVLIEVKDTPELKPGFEFKYSANYNLSDDIIAANHGSLINILKKVGPNNWVNKESFSTRYATFLGISLKQDKLLIKLTRDFKNTISYGIIEGVGERNGNFVDLLSDELPSNLFGKPLKDSKMDINNLKEVIVVQNEITGAYLYYVSNGNVIKTRLKDTEADIGRVFIDYNSIILHIDKSIIIYEKVNQNWDFTNQKKISGPFAAIGYSKNSVVASAPAGALSFNDPVATIFSRTGPGWATNQLPSAKLYIQDDDEIKNSLSFSIPDINSLDVAEKYLVIKVDLVNGSKSLRRKFIFKRFSNFWTTSKQSFKVSDVQKDLLSSNTSNYDFLTYRQSTGLMTIYDYENYCNLELYDQPTFTIIGEELDISKGVITLGGLDASSFDSGAKARYFGKTITLKPGLVVKSGATIIFKSVATCDDLYK
jgi:PKD repeat protein